MTEQQQAEGREKRLLALLTGQATGMALGAKSAEEARQWFQEALDGPDRTESEAPADPLPPEALEALLDAGLIAVRKMTPLERELLK